MRESKGAVRRCIRCAEVVGFACALRIKVKKRANVGTGEVAAANAADRAAAPAAAKASSATAATGDGASAHDAAKSGTRV